MSDFKKMNDADLAKTLKEKREALRVFRFGVAGSKTRNVKEASVLRRDIARVMTEISSKKNN
ncbi:50S ribosomal protein L29 [Patescibacteria group bacterium]|nr:MAG: 50S ribosomal protein L29 [Patescibacteria group bacterium]